MYPFFSINTVILYLTIGIIGMLCISQSNITHHTRQTKFFLLVFVLLYTCFATFRKIGNGVGGTDAPDYVNTFYNAFNNSVFERTTNHTIEPLYQVICKTIRYFTDDYHVFFFIIYAFMALSYILFIRKFAFRYNSCIPFLLLVFPYTRAFSSIRSSLGISFILMGLTIIDKHKWFSLFLIICSFFVHRMSILFVPIYFVYFLSKHFLRDTSRKTYFIWVVGCVFLSLTASRILQNYIIALQLLDGADLWYATHGADQDLLDRYPMFFSQILLLTALLWQYNRIKWDETSIVLRNLFLYDLSIIPAALLLGMYRFIEYGYLIRLSLWGVLIYTFCKNKNKLTKLFIHMVAFLLFTAWFVFRFYRTYETTSLSPYILDI